MAYELKTIVTYLQMLHRPNYAQNQKPISAETSLIRAYEPTIDFYRFLYNTVGKPWYWMERTLLNDTALADIINSVGVEIYVLYVSGVPAGFSEINRTVKGKEVQLSYFGLMPDFIGKGLGGYFLRATIDIAWNSNPKRVWVHTCDLDHPNALGLYQKNGFVVYNQAEEALPDPRIVGLPLPSTH